MFINTFLTLRIRIEVIWTEDEDVGMNDLKVYLNSLDMWVFMWKVRDPDILYWMKTNCAPFTLKKW